MENQQHGDEISFPRIPIEEESFEFGSGQIQDSSPESPADHLFLNGKLQPHDFPASRSSSVRSVDSVLSLRSNSTNSSCSSTARTSIREASSGSFFGSDSYERRSSLSQRAKVSAAGGRKRNSLSREEHSFWNEYYCQKVKKPTAALAAPDFGSSLRWQFITPVLGLKSQSSDRKFQKVDLQTERKENGCAGAGALLGWRVVRLFTTACLNCHAMNPAGADQ